MTVARINMGLEGKPDGFANSLIRAIRVAVGEYKPGTHLSDALAGGTSCGIKVVINDPSKLLAIKLVTTTPNRKNMGV
jgi:hypothetical protein